MSSRHQAVIYQEVVLCGDDIEYEKFDLGAIEFGDEMFTCATCDEAAANWEHFVKDPQGPTRPRHLPGQMLLGQ